MGRLKRYEGNAKRHPPEQIEQLRASFREFGWTIPLLIRDDGTLIAGHGRLDAAELEGFTEAPVVVARGWTDEQCRAYTLADNRLTELGEWDHDLLRLELGHLEARGYDLALTGFDTADLENALAGPAAAADGIEDPPASKYSEQYGVIVLCVDEADQKSVFERLKAEGLKVRVVAT
jgi:ParB-like chromosome segregation protein Spo0J